MTLPEAGRVVRTWWVPVAIVVLTVVIAVNYALLIPSLKRGGDARSRQQSVYPVSVKLYEDAHERGVISGTELDCFKTGRHCPPGPFDTP